MPQLHCRLPPSFRCARRRRSTSSASGSRRDSSPCSRHPPRPRRRQRLSHHGVTQIAVAEAHASPIERLHLWGLCDRGLDRRRIATCTNSVIDAVARRTDKRHLAQCARRRRDLLPPPAGMRWPWRRACSRTGCVPSAAAPPCRTAARRPRVHVSDCLERSAWNGVRLSFRCVTNFTVLPRCSGSPV